MFQPGRDWENNARINFKGDQQYAYSLGYKEAADFLANNASDMNMQDIFVYPIAFLYRHHLELQLKLIINLGRQLLNQEEAIKTQHNLQKAWSLAKEIIVRIWPSGNLEELNDIDYVVSEYQKIDPNSTTFRYSSDIQGNSHSNMPKYINIFSLYSSVNKAASILDNIYDGLVGYINNKGFKTTYS